MTLRDGCSTGSNSSRGAASRNWTEIPVVGGVLDWLEHNVQISTAHVQAWLGEDSKRLFEQLAAFGGIAFLGAVGTVLSFTVMLFVLFFIIRDGRPIARLGAAFVPLPPEQREELAERLGSVTRAVVRGTVLTAMIQGFLLGDCLRGRGPAGTGRLRRARRCAFGRAFRRHGTRLGTGRRASLMVQGSYMQAGILLVFGFIVSSVDNFLKPMLISGQSPLPTLAVFIGVLGGLAAFGLIGLFLGPIVIALVLALLEFAREKKP